MWRGGDADDRRSCCRNPITGRTNHCIIERENVGKDSGVERSFHDEESKTILLEE